VVILLLLTARELGFIFSDYDFLLDKKRWGGGCDFRIELKFKTVFLQLSQKSKPIFNL
jgi:hypothetical protein